MYYRMLNARKFLWAWLFLAEDYNVMPWCSGCTKTAVRKREIISNNIEKQYESH
jgi:hypothetical protein